MGRVFRLSPAGSGRFKGPVSKPPPRENLLVNLICNIAVPTYVLTALSKEDRLGPLWGLLIAVAFPTGYGIYDFIRRRKANVISIIGFTSVLLTGGLGLMQVGGMGFAIKEAVMPLLIGAAVMASVRSRTPLIRELFYNEQLIDLARVDAALAARSNGPAFDQLLTRVSLWLGAGFVLSAVLNFSLATYLLRSPPGTPEFNAELGRMHLLSWPVIVVPGMIIMMLIFWRLIVGLRHLTGLTTDEIFRAEHQAPKKD